MSEVRNAQVPPWLTATTCRKEVLAYFGTSKLILKDGSGSRTSTLRLIHVYNATSGTWNRIVVGTRRMANPGTQAQGQKADRTYLAMCGPSLDMARMAWQVSNFVIGVVSWHSGTRTGTESMDRATRRAPCQLRRMSRWHVANTVADQQSPGDRQTRFHTAFEKRIYTYWENDDFCVLMLKTVNLTIPNPGELGPGQQTPGAVWRQSPTVAFAQDTMTQ
ncbi:hypothetical protein B0T21DRAFT_352356 [Apiosordaria backusii]|uniref:Uncharacterized protein n=1 Tax=Apiosordaria backusii TaxID=314023 RepID=A0AA40DV84_9PEZI|nr:hypothetical protein B0T21DRAFT_352356 [Apiosordaria backusii]